MKSSSTGVFQDAGWVTSDGGAASLMLIADRPARPWWAVGRG